MGRPNAPRQSNGAALPADFARVLRSLYIFEDPRLGPTMKAANERGWSFALLGKALELTDSRARQIALKESGHEPVPDIPESVTGSAADRPHLAPEQITQLLALADIVNSLKAGTGLAEKARAGQELDEALLESWIAGVPFDYHADDLGFILDSVTKRVFGRARSRSKDFEEQPTRAKLPRGRNTHAVGFATRPADRPPYVITECDKYGDVGEFLPDDSPVTCAACQRAAEK